MFMQTKCCIDAMQRLHMSYFAAIASQAQCVHADFERPPSQEDSNAEQPTNSGSPRPSLYDLLWHATDSSVKPIVANRRIERLPEPKWDARALPFKALVSCCYGLPPVFCTTHCLAQFARQTSQVQA